MKVGKAEDYSNNILYVKTDGISRPLFLLLFMNIRFFFCQEWGIPPKQALNLNQHWISIESAPMIIQWWLKDDYLEGKKKEERRKKKEERRRIVMPM